MNLYMQYGFFPQFMTFVTEFNITKNYSIFIDSNAHLSKWFDVLYKFK